MIRVLLTSLTLAAAPAMAEQVVTLHPANFTLHTDVARKLCVASDHVLSARKEGVDVAVIMDADGRIELALDPNGFDRSAMLAQPVSFSFEDSLQITASAVLSKGRYLIALQEVGAQPTDLWIALRRRDYTIVLLPKRPEDRFGVDLRTMPAVYAQLQACQKEVTQ